MNQVFVNLHSTTGMLWRTSRPWKWTVMAAGAMSVLGLFHSLSTSSGSSGISAAPPIPTGVSAPAPVASFPPSPISGVASDPASDARLGTYQAAHDSAMAMKQPGPRCEALLTSFNVLDPEDIARAARLPAYTAAVNDGSHCQDLLNASNMHFAAVATAEANVDNDETIATLQAAIAAMAALDGFDQSRAKYADLSNVIAKITGYPTIIAQSDARVAYFYKAFNAFGADQSPSAYVALVNAYQQLSRLDRSRLTDAQTEAAQKALAALASAMADFHGVSELFPAAGGTPPGEPLIYAVAKVTAFDLAVATPAQEHLYNQAKATATPLAWSLLQKAVAAETQNENAKAVAAVAGLYNILKDTPTDGLNSDQDALLSHGSAAAAQMAASDARLQALDAAAVTWQAEGNAAGPSVIAPLQAITAFDQSRFGRTEQAAFTLMSQANAILNGPSIGLNAQSKPYIAIQVQAGSGIDADRVAAALQSRLSAAGFLIATSENTAVLNITVSVMAIDPAVMDLNSTFVSWGTTAHLAVSANWAINNVQLFSRDIDGIGNAPNSQSCGTVALSNAIDAVVTRFSEMTAD